MRPRPNFHYISLFVAMILCLNQSLYAQSDWYGNDHYSIETAGATTTVDMQKKAWESFSIDVNEFNVSGDGFSFNIQCLQTISLRVDMISTTNEKSTLVEQDVPANVFTSVAYTPSNISEVSHLIFYVNPGSDFNGQVQISDFTISDEPVLSVLLPSNELKVYPVPTRNNVFIEFPSKETGLVEIFNSQGMKIGEQNATGGSLSLQVSNLSNGVYFIKTRNRQGILTSRFIVQ